MLFSSFLQFIFQQIRHILFNLYLNVLLLSHISYKINKEIVLFLGLGGGGPVPLDPPENTLLSTSTCLFIA